MRDYDVDITKRLERLGLPLELLGTVHGYPIHQTHLPSTSPANSPPLVLVTGGVHGDEPAGVEAVFQFLERDNTELLKTFAFQVIPCINPYGYVRGTRETAGGIDINRSFETEATPEIGIVKKALGKTEYTFAIDFHEDYDATGFYLYEGNRGTPDMGARLAAAAKTIGPVDPEDPNDGDAPYVAEGAYKVSTVWGIEGLVSYLLHFHCDRVVISETPTVWQLDRRAVLHLTILDTALNIILEQKK